MPKDDGFINVDLEVGGRSRAELTPLVDALEGKLIELFRGRIRSLYRVHFEILPCRNNASATIHELAEVIEALKASGRRAWDAAPMRDFNIGVELARGVRSVEFAIDLDAVRRVAALGGRIAFTAYQIAAMRRGRFAGTGTKKSRPTTARKRRRTRPSRKRA